MTGQDFEDDQQDDELQRLFDHLKAHATHLVADRGHSAIAVAGAFLTLGTCLWREERGHIATALQLRRQADAAEAYDPDEDDEENEAPGALH